ncbi:lytic murein transglycosylase B [Limnohabitans radicicola]|uniref:Lytic murein transglycosylase B n=1 Tax=Limnohabitans radicicola TaxID=2771427 RepID=A0A927FFK6_9BURK|nr:lytic murein transglycosylase B [Limnohabitans radicicola]MBD8050489.1 lytic murein transglycosylase B [Limnohabitans radicicola]
MRRSPLLLSLLTYASALLASSLLLAATAQAASTAHKRHGSAHSNAHPKPKAKVCKGDKASPTGTSYGAREDAKLWAQDAANRLDLPEAWLQKQITQAQRIAVIEKLVLPPATPIAKNWAAYRARFIESQRIQAGARFWKAHQAALERAEREYGVPASIVVGIIGVETLYGQNTGNFRILDALATLAFDFPAAHPRAAERQAFFRSELEQFLLLTSRSGADPQSIKGSYAGAMGLPQFMPSSWARYAVDFDGDGRIDLFGSPTDAIGSVANYFKSFQWQPGMPTHYPVRLAPGQTDMDALLAPDILPTFSVSSFTAKGAQLDGPALQHTGPLALIELRNGLDAPSYVAGTENFYAITRYNWSSYYAMAVIELAEAVALEVKK